MTIKIMIERAIVEWVAQVDQPPLSGLVLKASTFGALVVLLAQAVPELGDASEADKAIDLAPAVEPTKDLGIVPHDPASDEGQPGAEPVTEDGPALAPVEPAAQPGPTLAEPEFTVYRDAAGNSIRLEPDGNGGFVVPQTSPMLEPGSFATDSLVLAELAPVYLSPEGLVSTDPASPLPPAAQLFPAPDTTEPVAPVEPAASPDPAPAVDAGSVVPDSAATGDSLAEQPTLDAPKPDAVDA